MIQSSFWEANRSSASQKIPRIYGTHRFFTVSTRARHLSISWDRWIQSMPPSHFTKIYFNIILPSTSKPHLIRINQPTILTTQEKFKYCSSLHHSRSQEWDPYIKKNQCQHLKSRRNSLQLWQCNMLPVSNDKNLQANANTHVKIKPI
jgi:hypothetical protein